MRVYRKKDYSRGVGVRKTAKNRKFRLPAFGQAAPFVNFRIAAALFAAILFSIVGISSAHAVTAPIGGGETAQAPSASDQAEAYVLYRVMGACVSQHKLANSSLAPINNNDYLEVSNAKNGNWFGESYGVGSYLYGLGGITVYSKNDQYAGWVNCNQPALVNEALRVFNWKYDEMLCAVGFKRQDDSQGTTRCTVAQGGTVPFNTGDVSKYASAVKSHVFYGNSPPLSNAAKYLLYLKAFKYACVPHATATTTKPAGNLSDREYAVKQVSGAGDSAAVQTTYYLGTDNKAHSDNVAIVSATSFGDPLYSNNTDNATCANLVSNINGFSDDYLAYAKANADAINQDDSQGGSESSGSTCTIEGVGWFICPGARFLGGIVDGFYVSIENLFLSTSPKLVTTDCDSQTTGCAYSAWQAILVIANIIFVIAFLFVIFSQATGYGISNYGVKKMLPKIIIGAILINLSFFLCQAAVDISNILGYGIHDLLKQVNDSKPISWGSIIAVILSAGVSTVAVGGAAVGVAAAFSTGLGIAGVLVAVIILGFIGLFLIAQKVLIVVCVVVSPIAFAAWLLPNTEKFFKYWWKIFYAMLIVFPLTSLVVGGSAIAASVIGGAISNL